jgi:hypothetical protein
VRALAFLLLAAVCARAAEEPPATVIKGARMDVLQKGEITEFKGGVTLTRGNDFMSADRMVSHDKAGFTQAWGHVYMRRRDPARGVLWEAWSDRGVYDTNVSSGTLWGDVFMEVRESTPSARLTRVWADRAERDPARGSLRFTGAHSGRGPRARSAPPWPPEVSPRPRVLQAEGPETRDLAGETVTYFETDGRVVAEGGVRAAWDDGRDHGAPR